MDIATGAVEMIAEDPIYDIAGMIMNPGTRAIRAVTVYRDRLEYKMFDDRSAAMSKPSSCSMLAN
jgi:hypothetical protein